MSKIRIAEMLERTNISDNDLMVVEDEIDTKRTTVKEFKRALDGDSLSPSKYKFFTSKKTNDLFNSLQIAISGLPTRTEFNDLSQQVKNIVGSTGSGKDSELVAARGKYGTLSERLSADQKALEEKYIQFPTLSYDSMLVDFSDYKNLEIDLHIPPYAKDTTIYIEGKNKFRNTDPGYDSIQVLEKGLKITYTKSQNAFTIPLHDNLPAGEYVLYTQPSFSENFIREGTVIKWVHSDNSVTVMDYSYGNMFRFTVGKPIKGFQILPNINTIVNGMWVLLDEIMLSQDDSITEYLPYNDGTIKVDANTSHDWKRIVSNCIIRRSEGTIQINAIDKSFTGDKIRNEIDFLKSCTTDPEDYCGLIVDKGHYLYAYNHILVNSPDMCNITVDRQKTRNSKPSMKITIMDYSDDDQPRFTLIPENVMNLSDSRTISFQLYIDKTLSERFSEIDGLKIMLSSDGTGSNPSINYMYFDIGKNSFVQGWNTIKIKLSDFKPHGNPNMSNITQINFRVFTSEFTNGKSFWINSVIIDQKIKPTVLFAFDGFYDNAFDYQYPYLYTRGIPVTIFGNDKQTLTKAYMEKVADLHYNYGWELANYGCNPNKELMIEDDNPREQYLAVRETRQWIYDNFTEKVISYAAPFGNLRPISEPILKELGFKIAKADADAYCSFFSKEDFIVPMHLLSNAAGKGADKVKAKIDEIVETGQVLCIYTNDVTKYGDDISATKTSFEAVIAHIQKYINRNELECMTFSEFYKKCVSK